MSDVFQEEAALIVGDWGLGVGVTMHLNVSVIALQVMLSVLSALA